MVLRLCCSSIMKEWQSVQSLCVGHGSGDWGGVVNEAGGGSSGVGAMGVGTGEGWSGHVVSGEGWSGHVVSGEGVLDDGCGASDLDNVLAAHWVWVWDGVWHALLDGHGHLDNLLDWLDDVIVDWVWLLDVDGLVDHVVLLLHGDHGGVDLLGALEGGWHGNADVRNGGLQDLGVVAGDVCLLSVVHLLGDLLRCLSDGHNIRALDLGGGVRGGHRDGGGCGQGNGGGHGVVGVAQSWGSDVMSGESQWGVDSVDWSSCCDGHLAGGGGGGGSNHCGQNCGHWVHDEEREVVFIRR